MILKGWRCRRPKATFQATGSIAGGRSILSLNDDWIDRIRYDHKKEECVWMTRKRVDLGN
jgi:hypothetical protein